jgi:putative ABC transport system permease protein
MYIDFNYLSFYNIHLLAGRNLSSTFGADRNGRSYIINETLARQLLPYTTSRDTSLAGLVGKGFRYSYEDSSGTIVGIARDFNFGSLHERIEPLCMSYQYEYYFIDISIRVDLPKMQQTLARAEQEWKAFLPAQQFSWYFLDDSLQQLYRSDRQTGTLIAIFAAIAFIISVLGLTGVAAFAIERRTKEIGIRKVLGATVTSILILLSRELLLLVLISICIALPTAWWATYAWMQGFAYHESMSIWIFAVVAGFALLVAAITVNIQATKAAMANPVKSLRLE